MTEALDLELSFSLHSSSAKRLTSASEHEETESQREEVTCVRVRVGPARLSE